MADLRIRSHGRFVVAPLPHVISMCSSRRLSSWFEALHCVRLWFDALPQLSGEMSRVDVCFAINVAARCFRVCGRLICNERPTSRRVCLFASDDAKSVLFSRRLIAFDVKVPISTSFGVLSVRKHHRRVPSGVRAACFCAFPRDVHRNACARSFASDAGVVASLLWLRTP